MAMLELDGACILKDRGEGLKLDVGYKWTGSHRRGDGRAQLWFPKSQLDTVGPVIFATQWIVEQKEKEIATSCRYATVGIDVTQKDGEDG